ncbi:MAG: DNA polymerase III subunit beta [Candidatus Pacebacteria bacterium]|nr:DNA polymerase III subunit beta [Candidatus Paceibacterota bacterium]
MKFKCVKKKIEYVLKNAEIFTGKNLDLPVLEGILLEVKKEGILCISSTNIDSTFYSEIPIVTKKEGKIVVLGDIFYKTILNIQNEEIEIFLEEKILKIQSKNNNIELNILDSNDFPSIIKIKDEKELINKIKILKNNFLNGLNSVIYAVSKSNIKPELSSVFINSFENNLFFVATDGFRLAEKKIEYKNNNEYSDFSTLIPSSFVFQIIKTFSNSESLDLIEIYFYKNQIFIKDKEYIISSRIINGNYIDYKKLIPVDIDTSVIFLKQDFINVIKLTNIFSDEFNQISLEILDNKFKIYTKNKIGRNNNTISSIIKGKELKMDFNHKFIQDSLNSINNDSMEFIFNIGKPLLINSVGDKTFKYIIMPLSK